MTSLTHWIKERTGFEPLEETIAALELDAPHALITARAGSGKTSLMAIKVAYSIAQGTPPHRTLSLCFNKAAATELGERIGRYGSPSAPASTFHALAYAIVQPSSGALLNALEQHSLIRKLIQKEKPDIRGERLTLLVRDVLSFISSAKKQGVSPLDLKGRIKKDGFPSLCARMYIAYQEHLAAHGRLDFDSLLERACTILQSTDRLPMIRLGGKLCDLAALQLLCIDEFQDQSRLFHQLTECLLKRNVSIQLYAVGDNWQAINGYAGSELRYFRDFSSLFPNAGSATLLANHRSGREIVEYANHHMRGHGASGVAIQDGGDVERITREVFAKRIEALVQEESNSILLLSRTNTLYGLPITSWQEILDKSPANIRISTIHSAKGTEADTVFVMKEPSVRHGDRLNTALTLLGRQSKDAEEEEHRLFYVAYTRAKKRLVIVDGP